MERRRSRDGSTDWEEKGEPECAVTLLGVVAIKFADLGHTLKPWPIHEAWSRRVVLEFYALGDREKALGVDVSPLCDRDSPESQSLGKSQVGFLSFVCLPFYRAVADLVDPEMGQLRQLESNLATWQREVSSKPKPAKTSRY